MADHSCGEAFRHMIYISKDGKVQLRVWNSRDGVTPFGCSHPVSGVELTHAPPWQLDYYDPGYVPEVGEWVWIDLHPERAMQLAMEKVEHFWDDPDYPLSGSGMSRSEAALMFVDSFLFWTNGDGEKVPSGTPDLVRVTQPLREQFLLGGAE